MSDMKLIMESWRNYQDEEPLTEGKLKDLWNALQQDVAAIKVGGIVPDRTIDLLLNRNNFKDLKGAQLIKHLEALKAQFIKQQQQEQEQGIDPNRIDLRVDSPAKLIANVEQAIAFVEKNPNDTFEMIQSKVKLGSKGRAGKKIASSGAAKMQALSTTLGKLIAMAAIYAPSAAEAGEMALAEQKTKRDK